MDLEGSTLRTYAVGPEIGRGAMGVVYRARTTRASPAGPAGATVALKILHADRIAGSEGFRRFRAEAHLGQAVHHPNLVRLFEFGHAEHGGRRIHFLAMELLEGDTLEARLAQDGALPEAQVIRVAEDVLAALEALHARGIVHRDVKPGNVVGVDGRGAVLMDFGIAAHVDARRTQVEDGFTGSMPYAAPEQFAGRAIGPRVDLYALGVTLYELATGAHPFVGLSVAALAGAKQTHDVPPPRTANASVSAFLSAVIETLMHPDPAARFPSASALRAVLAEGEASGWWRHGRAADPMRTPAGALGRLEVEQRTPFTGRATESARLEAAIGRAAGEGGTVVLRGPLGIGKTRLVAHHVGRVAGAGGPFVGVGRGAGRGQRAYGPLLELLEALPRPADLPPSFEAFLDGAIQPGSESGLSKEAMVGAVLRMLRAAAGRSPLVLVIDDLHLAGDEMIELVAHALPRTAGHPILWILVYESDATPEAERLDALVASEAAQAPAAVLTLEAMPVSEAGELVRFLVGHERTLRDLLVPLHARSEGNPLILLEVLAQLERTGALKPDGEGLVLAAPLDAVEIPTSIREVIAAQLTSLDEAVRELLEVAAILGVAFDAGVLAEVLEDDDVAATLDALASERGLVVPEGDGFYRFTRYPVYEVVLGSVAPALRAEYHDVVADVLHDRGVDTDGAAFTLLVHLLGADRGAEILPHLDAALRHLAAHHHASFAAPLLERLAAALEGAPADARLSVAMAQWSVYDRLGQRAEQLRVLDVAHALATVRGDPGPLARIHGLRAGSWWYAGDYDRTHEEAEAGLRHARLAGDRTWEATCLHTLGVVAFRRGELERCASLWHEALALRREIDDVKGQASTLQALSLILPALGESERVLETMQASLALWRQIGERRGEASMLMNIGNHLIDAARYEEGLDHLERALAAHRDTGAVTNETLTLTNLGRAQHVLGRIEDARRSWEQALELFITLENPNGELATRLNLGSALWLYGNVQEARDQLEATIALARRLGSRTHLAMAFRDLGALHHASGERDRAWLAFDEAFAVEEELGSTTSRIDTALAAAHAALREEDGARARALLAPVIEDARADATRAPLALLRLARSERACGEGERARALAEEALARIADAGRLSLVEAPEIRYTLHRLLPDHPDAAAWLAEAEASLLARADAIRTDAWRAWFLDAVWPNPEIRAARQAAR